MAEAVQQTEHGNYLSLDPNVSQAIVESIAKQIETLSFKNSLQLCYVLLQ